MKLYRLQRTQTLPVGMQEAWQFFSSPVNLPLITPAWLNFALIGNIPERMFPGLVICYRLTPLLGIPITWISEITHVDPPTYFVDEQRFGPYRFWHHQHYFRPVNGGVEMTDRVSYCLKYQLVGTVVHAFFVRKRLSEIFDFRQRTLERHFNRQAGHCRPSEEPSTWQPKKRSG